MFSKAYVCMWCKKDLKSKEIPPMSKAYYPEEDSHFTEAIELFNNRGFECPYCEARWNLDGKIIRNGKEELKDKYGVEENKDNINNKENQEEVNNG